MSLKGRLTEDMKSALRAGDKPRLAALRLALAAVKQREVDTRQPLDDAGVQSVLDRLIKQGRDAVTQYRDGAREDLAAKEAAEVEVWLAYLPEPLTDEELEALIADAIDESGARGPGDIGKVMPIVKARAAGRVDMKEVNARVRAALADD
jgi:uncharacterized protein YqeY